jgi:guanylate cyclase
VPLLLELSSWCVFGKEYKLGLLIPYNNVDFIIKDSYFVGQKYAAAMSIAVHDVNEREDLLRNDTLTFKWKDTNCNEFTTLRHQIKMIQSNFTAFIGPGCHCQMAAKNAAAFNKTMISYVSIYSTAFKVFQTSDPIYILYALYIIIGLLYVSLGLIAPCVTSISGLNISVSELIKLFAAIVQARARYHNTRDGQRTNRLVTH